MDSVYKPPARGEGIAEVDTVAEMGFTRKLAIYCSWQIKELREFPCLPSASGEGIAEVDGWDRLHLEANQQIINKMDEVFLPAIGEVKAEIDIWDRLHKKADQQIGRKMDGVFLPATCQWRGHSWGRWLRWASPESWPADWQENGGSVITCHLPVERA
jgi:hypothetical protein